MHTKRKQAFTLVEIMVVVSVIAILALASFRLMKAAAHNKKVAETQARMERLQNALSGYYAQYGHYPPVPFYSSMNPEEARNFDSNGVLGNNFAAKAKWASRAQPMAYEYPPPAYADQNFIDVIFNRNLQQGDGRTKDMFSSGIAAQFDPKNPAWDEGPKAFKFGLLSFLLPRLEVANFAENSLIRDTVVFSIPQWLEHNPATPQGLPKTQGNNAAFSRAMQAQRLAENEACARWLPHLEHTINGLGAPILGVNIWSGTTQSADDGGGFQKRVTRLAGGGDDLIATMSATCVDAWYNSFYYHSLPPYQSYILWSAGPDGNTFPPWIDSKDPYYIANKKAILEMIKDDIVGGRM